MTSTFGTYDSPDFGNSYGHEHEIINPMKKESSNAMKIFVVMSVVYTILAICTASFQIATKLNCAQFKGTYNATADVLEVFAWITIAISVAYLGFGCYMLWETYGRKKYHQFKVGKAAAKQAGEYYSPLTDIDN